MKNPGFWLVLILVLFLPACGLLPQGSIASSELARDVSPVVSESDQKTLLEENNAFAFDFFCQVIQKKGNLVYSPYSISLATAMLYAGAGGETSAQIANVLHYSLTQDILHPAMNKLSLDLGQRTEQSKKVDPKSPMQLEIANALWGQRDYPFEKTYLDLLAVNYGAGIRLMDFAKDPDAARQKINQWVADQTAGKIKDVLPPGSIDPSTRLVLTNAVYFKAAWSQAFDKSSTKDSPFTLLSGEEILVPTMRSQTAMSVRTGKGEGYQVVAIPYKGNLAELLILMPDEGQFETFENSLDPARYAIILAALQPASSTIYLPKFEFSADFDLISILSSMGMPLAFDENQADFSNITRSEKLYVQRALHKAYILADEQGTEAAAVTIYAVPASALPFELHIDRPFIFILRDVPTGTILFMGRVLNPLQK